VRECTSLRQCTCLREFAGLRECAHLACRQPVELCALQNVYTALSRAGRPIGQPPGKPAARQPSPPAPIGSLWKWQKFNRPLVIPPAPTPHDSVAARRPVAHHLVARQLHSSAPRLDSSLAATSGRLDAPPPSIRRPIELSARSLTRLVSGRPARRPTTCQWAVAAKLSRQPALSVGRGFSLGALHLEPPSCASHWPRPSTGHAHIAPRCFELAIGARESGAERAL